MYLGFFFLDVSGLGVRGSKLLRFEDGGYVYGLRFFSAGFGVNTSGSLGNYVIVKKNTRWILLPLCRFPILFYAGLGTDNLPKQDS